METQTSHQKDLQATRDLRLEFYVRKWFYFQRRICTMTGFSFHAECKFVDSALLWGAASASESNFNSRYFFGVKIRM